jgi:hypothetical protein
MTRFMLKGFCLGLCLLALVPLKMPAQSKEYQVKAAFLFNFAQFVDWPGTVFTNTDTPFVIGILGNDPFGAALDATVQGETINNHKIIIERAHAVDDLKNCQLLFVSKSEKNHVTEILSALDSRPVLKVSEIEGFARQGGNINFYLDGSKVRFEVNPTVSERDGLKVSSQLLNLGKIIQTPKEGQ